MFKCPVCQGSMPTMDVNDADHVALGQVVCSSVCHAKMYDAAQYGLVFDECLEFNPQRPPGDP